MGVPKWEVIRINVRLRRLIAKLPSNIVAILAVLAIAATGSYLLLTSHAATPTASVEPENGTATASVVNDTSASGGKAVKFGTHTTLATVNIWPIGDSVTEGQNADNKNGYRLDLWNALTGAGYSINYVGTDNYGLSPLPDLDTNGESGSCIRANPCFADDLYDMTATWFPQLAASGNTPNIIIMDGGANDYCCGNTQDSTVIEGYVQQWTQQMWTLDPNAYLIYLGITGGYHDDLDTWIQQYVTQLQGQGKRIAYVYTADVTTNDTVHPDNPGYQTITNRIVPLITPMMQALTGH